MKWKIPEINTINFKLHLTQSSLIKWTIPLCLSQSGNKFQLSGVSHLAASQLSDGLSRVTLFVFSQVTLIFLSDSPKAQE